ncbi:serine hydrolase [Actinoplanes sp. NPDC051346]|uniref:serine hydrolase n=1 Tax=Actinoplanes sp. NPDC051346 TaxID=3155048 RepID=UPI003442C3E3
MTAFAAAATALLTAHDATAWIHARDLGTAAELSLRGDEPVPASSLSKVPLLVTLYRLADAGLLDLAETVTIGAADRSPGPTGLSVLQDDAGLSLRDLATLAVTVSDNTAADVLFRRVELDTINHHLDALGLTGTRVATTMRQLFADMRTDAGIDPHTGRERPLTDPEAVGRLRVLDPARTSRTTAAETTALFAGIWLDQVATPASCAELRRPFTLQVWPHRLASGFPYDDVVVAGKTASLPTMRAEAGVISYPDGGRYALCVLIRSGVTSFTAPRLDALIGTLGRLAVDHLRETR